MLYLSNTRDNFTKMILFYEFIDKDLWLDPKLFGHNPYIKKIEAEHTPLSSRVLLLEKETGSWCLCSKKELTIINALHEKRMETIFQEHANRDASELREFILRLYCRGLLTINNRSLYAMDVFKGDVPHPKKALFVVIPTTKCNLACRYCYSSQNKTKPKKMDRKTAKKIIDLIMTYPSENATILFHGGESLLAFDIVESMVKYAYYANRSYKKNLRFRLQTNATVLSKSIAQKLAALDIGLGMSFDGAKQINDKTRIFKDGKSSFNLAVKGLLNARQKQLQFGSICVINHHNYDCISEVLDFYTQIGLSAIKMNPVAKLGRAQNQWESIEVSLEQYFKAQSHYLNILQSGGKVPIEENVRHMINNISSKMSFYMCMRAQCGAGQDFFAFSPNGTIYPCDRFGQTSAFALGNVHSLTQLSGIRNRNMLVSSIFKRSIEKIAECRHCSYKQYCRGGCTFDTYIHFKDSNSVHPWCEYYKKMYRRLFLFVDQTPHLAKYLSNDVTIFNHDFFIS